MTRLTDQQVEEGIIATICYFDLFDYPLTLAELAERLYIPEQNNRDSAKNQTATLEDLLRIMKASSKIRTKIETAQGFYFLTGRSLLIRERLARYNLAEAKYRKTRRLIALLKFFPFIRFIGVCNTLGYSNARRDSDIDLLIFVADGHMWTARWWTVSLAKLLGIRPTPTQSKDRFCFSFFLNNRKLDISAIRIHQEDVYLSYWAATIVPMYDAGGYFQQFRAANQALFHNLHNTADYQVIVRRKVWPDTFSRSIQKSWEWVQDGFWETFYKKLQQKIMPRKLRQLGQKKGSGVIMNEQMLKFHDRDRRQEFHARWQEKRAA